jgi:hypothetical protein
MAAPAQVDLALNSGLRYHVASGYRGKKTYPIPETGGEQSPSGIAVPSSMYGPMTMREGKHDSGRHPRGTTRGGVIFSK